MGKSALASHSKGNKHQVNVKNYSPVSGLFFKSNPPKPSSSKDASPATNKIDLMMSTLAVSHAEIRWALKVLTSHHSFRLNLNQLFCVMFPDSDIAKSFQLSKTKCAYYIVHGLAPYFMEILLQEINLNHYKQEEQMDVQIRFWNENLYEVQTRIPNLKVFQAPKCR